MTADSPFHLEDKLISAAYTVAIEPHRFLELEDLVRDYLLNHPDADQAHSPDAADGTEGSLDTRLDDFLRERVQPHFDQAQKLLERQGQFVSAAVPGRASLEASDRPTAQVATNGSLLFVNSAAQLNLGWHVGRNLLDYLPSRRDKQAVRKALGELEFLALGEVAHTFSIASDDGVMSPQLAIVRSENQGGQIVGQLAALSMDWNDTAGQRFGEIFSLTAAEVAVTKAVVSGTALQDLAAARGRSIGTVRNQLKHLLHKLGLRSKTELIGLYSGFSQLSRMPAMTPSAATDPSRRPEMVERTIDRAEGREPLRYRVYGQGRSRTVLCFSSYLGGTFLSREAMRIAREHDLKFILPVLPGDDATPFYGDVETLVDDVCADAARILDAEGAGECVALGVNGRSPFAFGMARAAPGRVRGIVLASPALPFVHDFQYAEMSPAMRVLHTLARRAPTAMRFLVRAAHASVNAGHDEEYGIKLLQGSTADLATIRDPEHRLPLRKTLVQSFQNSSRAPAEYIRLLALDWSADIEAAPCPVRVVAGAQNKSFSARAAQAFGESRAHWQVEVLDHAGLFIMLQAPARVLQACASLFEESA